MVASTLLVLTLFTAPPFRVEPGIPPEAERIATQSWMELERLIQAEGISPPASPRTILITSKEAGFDVHMTKPMSLAAIEQFLQKPNAA